MERRLGIGRRINFFRRLHGLTQKELGALLGFSEKSCDVRIAQYESGDRIPKDEMLCKLAAAFKISPQALQVPELGSWIQRMHIFFAMEDMYGAKLRKIDEDYYLRIEEEDNDELVTGVRNAVLQEWLDKRQVPAGYMELLKLKKEVQQAQEKQTKKVELTELEQRYQAAEALITKELASLREEIEKLKEKG